MGALSYRRASVRDLIDYYGERPRETVKGIVVFLDGQPAGVIGIARDRDASRIFSEHKPALEPHLRRITVLRAIKAAMRLVQEHRGVLYAVPKDAEGARIIERLGFTREGEVYRWRDSQRARA